MPLHFNRVNVFIKPTPHSLVLDVMRYTDLMFVDLCIIVHFIQKNPTRCNSVTKLIIPH